MPTNFSLRKLFKSTRSKRVGNPEVQNDTYPPDGSAIPPVVSETAACDAETSMAPKLSQPQNPSVVASVDGEASTKAASSSVTEPQAPSNPPVADAQGTPASPDAGGKKPRLPESAVQETSKASSSDAAQAQVPPSALLVTDAHACPARTDPRAKEPLPATESEVHPSLSQKLWNDAYDLLEKDNTELVDAYIKTLVEILVDEGLKDLKAKKAAGASAAKANDVSAERKKIMTKILDELRDPKTKKATDTSAVGASDVPAELEKLRADVLAQLREQNKRQIFMKKLVEEGQTKTATASKITEGISDAAQFILSVITTANPVIQNIPQAAPAALPLAGACIGLKILSKPGDAARSNRDGIAHVVSTMEWYCALTNLLDEKNIVTRPFQDIRDIRLLLEKRVVALYRAILLYQMKSVCSYYRKQYLVFFRALVGLEKWDGDLSGVKDAENAVQEGSKKYNEELAQRHLRDLDESARKMEERLGAIHLVLREFIDQQQERQADSENKQCLQHLYVVNPQSDVERIENRKENLFDDACKWILEDENYRTFTNWKESDPPPCRLLWVKGYAGTGKTMLLIRIIRELSGQLAVHAPTLSYFFCQSRGETKQPQDNATATLKSLVWMLVIQQPHLISHLLRECKYSSTSVFNGDSAFYLIRKAFYAMLKDPGLSPVYFIVDALDECDQKKPGRDELIDLISESLALSDKVRWLVSSRPEIDVDTKLKNRGTSRIVELDDESLRIPVNAYIDYKLLDLEGKTGYDGKTLDQVSKEIKKRAENTFLWVWHVFQVLNQENGWNAVKFIKDFNKIRPDLSDLYDAMMSRIENRVKGDLEYCIKVLVVSTLAYRPLSLSELEVLAKLPLGSPGTIVKECGSFLKTKDDTVYLIHQSAKEWLENTLEVLDENHNSRLQTGGAIQGHADISRRSIDAMSNAMSKLRKNIYNLPHLGSKSKDIIVPSPDPLEGLQYSCIYWVQHVCQVYSQLDLYQSVKELQENAFDLHDNGDVHRFLKEHFLHWLEALSLMGKVSLCLPMIIELENSTPKPSELCNLVYDAERFILKFRSIIELAPLQIYSSALLFSPQASIVRELFQKEIDWVKISSGVEKNWSPALQTLEGHSDSVWSVLFSPDGGKLVSASNDGTIRVWDVSTGQVEQTLEGHLRSVNCVVFSPNRGKLASASNDGTVRVWDLGAGQVERTFEDSGELNSVVFSPDGDKLVSASSYSTIRVWDVGTGQVEQTLEGHLDSVNSVVFSPNGAKLASASDDRTVRVWDVGTGQVKWTLKGHSDSVNSVVFSPNGSKLASASSDETVQVWDVTTGQVERTLEGHSDSVYNIVFSPDGSKLISASSDGTVQMWDVNTWQVKYTLEGHSQRVSCVVFSPNGAKLALTSDDRTIQVWDISTGQVEYTLKGHLDSVNSVVFSPDGSKLASVSRDRTVRIWDLNIKQVEYMLEGHLDSVNSIIFSPNGGKLASASYDRTVRVWDVGTGQVEYMLKGHWAWVKSIVFSPDGSKLASASNDRTVRVWDVGTGQIEYMLEGHSDMVVFSPNGAKLASASSELTVQLLHSPWPVERNRSSVFRSTIRVWDLGTRQVERTFEDHSGELNSVVFSPNGDKLVSASSYGTIRVWNVGTGQVEQTLEGHLDSVNSVVFSPNGAKLASASDDCTVRVWDINTGQVKYTLEGHSQRVSSVVFSPDGDKLASASNNSTIQVWDVGTGQVKRTLEGHSDSVNSVVFSPDGSKPDLYQPETTRHRLKSRLFYSVEKSGCWVTQNGVRILHLPVDYRPGRMATKGNYLAIASSNGRVTIITFYFEVKT